MEKKIFRNDAEENEERDDASVMKKFIADATSVLDKLSTRMDSMEERLAKKDAISEAPAKTEERKDEESESKDDSTVIYRGNKAPSPNRKDAEDKDERKDESEDEKKEREDAEEKERADKARKDAEEKERKDAEEKERADAARKDAASDERLKRLEATLGDVVKVLPKARSDEDYHAMCDIQARADEVYSALGQRSAPRFLDGEDSMGYRRRLVRDLKKHSPDWKDVNIHAIADEAAFSVMERRVYADALNVAKQPVTAEAGSLRPVTRRNGGHEITEYVGETRVWFDDFAGPTRMFATSISNGAQR